MSSTSSPRRLQAATCSRWRRSTRGSSGPRRSRPPGYAESIAEEIEQTQAHFQRLLSDINEGRSAFAQIRRGPVTRADSGNGSVAELVEAILEISCRD